ncbi:hypothetical protein OG292_07080 [Streptomyces sp. NBC_01511]
MSSDCPGCAAKPYRRGVHTPEALLDASYAVERLAEIGGEFADAPGDK